MDFCKLGEDGDKIFLSGILIHIKYEIFVRHIVSDPGGGGGDDFPVFVEFITVLEVTKAVHMQIYLQLKNRNKFYTHYCAIRLVEPINLALTCL